MSDINTGADLLANLVQEEGRISVDQAAKRLDVSPELIEEWAHLMEESALLTIEFGLRRTFLVPFEENKSVKKKGTHAIRAKIENTHWRFAQDKDDWERFRKQLDEERERFEKKARPTLKQLKKLKRYSGIADTIKEAEKRIDELTPKVEKRFKKSKRQLTRLDTQTKTVKKRTETSRKTVTSVKRNLKKAQELLENAQKELHGERSLLATLSKEYARFAKNIEDAEKHAARLPKKKVKETHRTVLQAASQTHADLKERAKTLKEQEKLLSRREKKLAAMEKRLAKAARSKRAQLTAIGQALSTAQPTPLLALVSATETLLDAGDTEAARTVYTHVRERFSQADEAERSTVYERCVAIHRRF